MRRVLAAWLLIGSPALPRVALPGGSDSHSERDRLHGAPIVYVHAKVSVFDDRAAIVASADLNGRRLKWDSEEGTLLSETDDVDALH